MLRLAGVVKNGNNEKLKSEVKRRLTQMIDEKSHDEEISK